MRHRSRVFRCFVTLVAAWYAGISSGQLSLAESVVAASRAAMSDQQRAQEMSSGTAVMAGMDCHGPSVPGAPKHPCTCIDRGCYQVSVALHVAGTTTTAHARSVGATAPAALISYAYLAPDYTLPFANAPPVSRS